MFWAYLQGMETEHKGAARRAFDKFWAYLQGMETSRAFVASSPALPVLSLPTRNGNAPVRLEIVNFNCVLSLPTRNGNNMCLKRYLRGRKVLSLPTRNGNYQHSDNLHSQEPVLSLPTRNGNIRVAIDLVKAFASVLSLPTRNGNLLPAVHPLLKGKGFEPTYKEWKQKKSKVKLPCRSSVLSLPTRNGNKSILLIPPSIIQVLSLPTRNGNFSTVISRMCIPRTFWAYLQGMETSFPGIRRVKFY